MEFDVDQLITPVMRTAVILFNARSDEFLLDVQMTAKADCLLARFNDISDISICLIIAEEHAPLSSKWHEKKSVIRDQIDKSRYQALIWLTEAVEKIENNVNKLPREKIFHLLGEAQRKEIYSAVFDQYPIWLMSRFHSMKAKTVKFRQIFQSVDSPDRIKYRQFYRYMFVDLSEDTYRIGNEIGAKVRTIWQPHGRNSQTRARFVHWILVVLRLFLCDAGLKAWFRADYLGFSSGDIGDAVWDTWHI
jgi:hypothetical protein